MIEGSYASNPRHKATNDDSGEIDNFTPFAHIRLNVFRELTFITKNSENLLKENSTQWALGLATTKLSKKKSRLIYLHPIKTLVRTKEIEAEVVGTDETMKQWIDIRIICFYRFS